MDRIVYTALTGAKQSLDRQATISNNLANVSTTGFREQLSASRAVSVQGDARLDTRSVAVETTPGSNFQAGAINQTGRPMDVAMAGDAWLGIIDDQGSEAYTRRGDLQVMSNGMLTIGTGQMVMGNAGPVVVPPGSDITISDDGSVNIRGGNGALVPVGQLKLVSPGDEGLVRGDDGFFRPTASLLGQAAVLEADESLRIRAGALEGSNVSATNSMVDMIAAQRQFEMNMKTIESADENARTANSLLSLRG